MTYLIEYKKIGSETTKIKLRNDIKIMMHQNRFKSILTLKNESILNSISTSSSKRASSVCEPGAKGPWKVATKTGLFVLLCVVWRFCCVFLRFCCCRVCVHALYVSVGHRRGIDAPLAASLRRKVSGPVRQPMNVHEKKSVHVKWFSRG